MTLMRRLWGNHRGQDLAEYGIALAIIGAGTVIVALIINGPIVALWTQAQTVIASS